MKSINFKLLTENDIIRSKPTAALRVINRLPKEYQPALERARFICMGETSEHWNDIGHLIQSCADFMSTQINKRIIWIQNAGYIGKSISLDNAS